jgi:transcriptional regulator with XRE-family HTH domain
MARKPAPVPLAKIFGKRLRQERLNTPGKLSQEELATRAGLPKTSVLDIERGRRRAYLDEAVALAAVLSVPLTSLLIPSETTTADVTVAGKTVTQDQLRRWLIGYETLPGGTVREAVRFYDSSPAEVKKTWRDQFEACAAAYAFAPQNPEVRKLVRDLLRNAPPAFRAHALEHLVTHGEGAAFWRDLLADDSEGGSS